MNTAEDLLKALDEEAVELDLPKVCAYCKTDESNGNFLDELIVGEMQLPGGTLPALFRLCTYCGAVTFIRFVEITEMEQTLKEKVDSTPMADLFAEVKTVNEEIRDYFVELIESAVSGYDDDLNHYIKRVDTSLTAVYWHTAKFADGKITVKATFHTAGVDDLGVFDEYYTIDLVFHNEYEYLDLEDLDFNEW